MPEIRKCSECGTPLNDDAAEGFCPACMLQGALHLSPIHEPESEIPETQGSKRLGDYELLDEVARGGMGVVYRGRQISLDRLVAVKLILFSQFADKAAVRRFKAEATAAARLRHPNIVAIHEIGEEAGQHFFSMDYVDGPSLADFMRQQPIPFRQGAQFLKTIAEAVHYAHEQGIVHRDLKPSNILIDGLREPRITDFGLARDLKGDSDLTLTGQVLGSPNYISPEQASGKVVGAPSDIYSLGAILYHVLCGRPPFAGETLTDTLNQVTTREAVSPRLLNPSVPRDLETICLKCLEKEPAKRYPTAAALAQDLGRFLENAPITARPVGKAERAWRWCRRKPIVAGLTAAFFASIVLGFAGVLWQWRRAEQHAEVSRRNLYAADMLLAQGALEAGYVGRARELLQKYLPRKGEKDLRGWEWRYAWDQCRSDDLFSLNRDQAGVGRFALSADGTILVSGSGDGSVVLWDLKAKEAIRTFAVGDKVYGLAFSRDEKQLIVATEAAGVSIWNCDTWQRTTTLTNLASIRSVAVSPDGKVLAILGLRWLMLWNWMPRATDQAIARLEVQGGTYLAAGGLAFSRDSSFLAYNQGDGTIVFLDLATGEATAKLQGHESYVTTLAFSPDGSSLVSASYDGTVRVWDVRSGKEIQRIGNISGHVNDVAFSPDGGLLAVVGMDQRVKLFETRSWEEINALKGHSRVVKSVAFSPDGKRLITGSDDGTIKLWTVSTNDRPVSRRLPADLRYAALMDDARHLYLARSNGACSVWRTGSLQETSYPSPLSHPTAGTISPDGKLWTAATTNGWVKIFDHGKAQFIAELPCPGGPTTELAFSRDGRTLAALGNDLTCRVWKATPMAGPKDGSRLSTQQGAVEFQEVAVFGTRGERMWFPPRLSHSGHLLALGYVTGQTDIWNTHSSQKLATLRGEPLGVRGLCFSRDDSTLISASMSGNVQVWDLGSAREIATLSGHSSPARAVALSPDESRLAACSFDGNVRLWDMETKQEVARLKLHKEPLDQLAFSEDGSLVVLAFRIAEPRIFILRAPEISELATTKHGEPAGPPQR